MSVGQLPHCDMSQAHLSSGRGADRRCAGPKWSSMVKTHHVPKTQEGCGCSGVFWIFLGVPQVTGKFRANPRKIAGRCSLESQSASNSRTSGIGTGKPVANIGSALPWTLCTPSVQGVFFEIDSSSLLELFFSEKWSSCWAILTRDSNKSKEQLCCGNESKRCFLQWKVGCRTILDNFIAHSKNSTHLKLRKLPKLFHSSNVRDFPCTASFWKDAVVQLLLSLHRLLWVSLKRAPVLCWPLSWPPQFCPQLPCFPTILDGCVEMWPSESRSMRMRLLHVFHFQPRHWGNPVSTLQWSKQTMWDFHDMTTSPCNLMTSHSKPFFIIFCIKQQGHEALKKQTSDTNWIDTFPRPQLMKLSALSHITNYVLSTQRIWTLVYVKFQTASWQFAPETAKMQPRQPTPKHNLQHTSKHKIAKKVLRGC